MDVINLHHLETTPDLVFEEIISQLEPKSLIRLCSTSKLVRERCRRIWRPLYKRDISTIKPPCNNPDWRRLYISAITRNLPVYEVSLFNRSTRETESKIIAIGKLDLDDELNRILTDVMKETDQKVIDKEIKLAKEMGELILENEYEEKLDLRISYIDQIPIKDLLNISSDKDHSMYETTISSGKKIYNFVSLGFNKLLESIASKLDDIGIEEEYVKTLIDQLKDEEEGLEPIPYEVYGDEKSAEVEITEIGLFRPGDLEMAFKEICSM